MCNPKMRSISRRKTACVFGESNRRRLRMDRQRLRAAGYFNSTILITLFALISALLLFSSASFAQDFDIIIANGRIVDCSGNPSYEANVGIRRDRIVSIGDLSRRQATQIIDASGLIVSPGFIDPHTHALGECCKGRAFRPFKTHSLWRDRSKLGENT